MAQGDRKASPEKAKALRSFLNQQTDWVGQCRHCGKKIEGKLEDMRCDCGLGD